MSTTVSYKGSTLTTFTNATKTFSTSGKWLEDNIVVQDVTSGGNYQTKSVTLSDRTTTITPDSGYDAMTSVTATMSWADVVATGANISYKTVSGERKCDVSWAAYAEAPGYVGEGEIDNNSQRFDAIPANTTITPTTSSQTIGGANYMMEGAVTVSAMPTMTLPNASSTSSGSFRADVLPSTAAYKYINIPTGYNGTAQYYRILKPEVAPLSVTSNGTYNASDPQYDIDGFSTVTVNVAGSPTLQSKSVTLTESPTTITPDSGYDAMTSVTASIDADYVGSGITRRDSNSLSIMANVVIVPAGYYASRAQAQMAVVTAGTPTATKGTVSNHSVSVTPSVTNPQGYIASGTINGTAVTVSASELVSGSETKTSNGTYDVTNLASITVSVPTNLTKYAIRPDAVLANSYTYDKYMHEDEEITMPSYSTSAQTIKASEAIASITLDRDNYYYYIVERMLTIPTYSITTTGKGRCELHMGAHVYEIVDIPANSFHAIIDPTKYYATRLNLVTSGRSIYRELYYSNATTIATYSTQAYGVCQAAVAPSISSGVVTINSPTVTCRGSTTYFVNTYANAMTDVRAQYVIEVYKAPKDSLNYDAWGNDQLLKQIIDGINSNNHKLT